MAGTSKTVVAEGNVPPAKQAHNSVEMSDFRASLPVYVAAPPGQEYVDPFLFETGHFESREEYEELSRTAKIKPRARA